jgi:glycosyltransferase involved in cell wall biosynthesis
MLRALGEKGGIGVYTRNVVTELLRLDTKNDYVLLYRDRRHLGAFAGHERVRERVIPAANKALWDQVAVPLACRRHRLDVLFHPKFTAPLAAPCPVVMTVHGADWYLADQAGYYSALDVGYIRAFMPLYFRKCAAVISVSQLTTEQFERALRPRPGKVRTVYFAPARHFRPIEDRSALAAARARYQLPDRFILSLAKRAGEARKNLGQLLHAYATYHARTANPIPLVIGGEGMERARRTYALPDDGYGRYVHFPGWLDQADLPAIYSLAKVFLYPSNLEAFPIPIAEAMACGAPIVTSAANGLEEIAGDGALLVDHQDAGAIAAALERVLGEDDLRQALRQRGLARARRFTWDECAAKTLAILEEAACGR